MQALVRGTEAIRQGKLGIQVEVDDTSGDEIGQLAGTFNKMSSQLAQMEEMRQRFLADTAHELRTPLAILSGNLENMLSGVSKPSLERLFSMQEEVMRLSRLVENLLDLSLARLHKLPLDKKPVD
ncbi:MAG: HAMP domain-containing protein, partial [Selenomonas sp.]|nr:HAMP domain-containing protein [Selenomonas sp.]